jgi:hypothetical protein
VELNVRQPGVRVLAAHPLGSNGQSDAFQSPTASYTNTLLNNKTREWPMCSGHGIPIASSRAGIASLTLLTALTLWRLEPDEHVGQPDGQLGDISGRHDSQMENCMR